MRFRNVLFPSIALGLAFAIAASGGGCKKANADKDGAASGSASERVVPVAVAKVEKKDVAVYLDGLGNVAAFNTVTVKPRVEGRIDKVVFTEGQSVKPGDLLVQIDPRPFQIQVQLAQATLARDQAQLADDKVNLQRYTQLLQGGVGSEQQVVDQRAAVAKSEALTLADAANLENARLQLEWSKVTSPIEGVTGVRLVDPGNVVHLTDPGLVVVTQLDPIAVFFTLPEDDLARVHDAMAKDQLVVEAYSRDANTLLGKGKLAVIDNEINTATATIRLKAIFDNPDRHLWPNQFVRARLMVGVEQGALVVPATAPQRGPTGVFAYIVGKDATVEMRPIEVKFTQGDVAVIKGGIKEGETIVTDGQNQLRPGAKVQARPAGSASASASTDAEGEPPKNKNKEKAEASNVPSSSASASASAAPPSASSNAPPPAPTPAVPTGKP